ncbi:MAG: YgjV family protein [Firmicutes bacterium]|nr:YgjV family protein [Bacillota bacterium]
MTESVFFVQALGFLGLASMVISFQMKNATRVLVMDILANVFFGIQYLLLGSVSGMIVLTISMVRNILLLLRDRWPKLAWKGWVVVLIAAEIALCAPNIINWYDILPIIGFIIVTVSFWGKDPQKLRFANLILVCPIFLLFNLLVGSWGGVINEIITWVSVFTAFLRYRKQDKKEISDSV